MTTQDHGYSAGYPRVDALPARKGGFGAWLRRRFVPEPDSVDPTLASLFLFPVSKWRVILVCAILGAIVGFGIARIQTPKYVATLTLIPNTDDQISNMGGLSGLGSLSALAGGGGLLAKPERVTPYQQFRAMMSSLDVARELERRGNYLARLHPNLWDAEKGAWKPKPYSTLQPLKDVIKDILRIHSYPHPNIEDLVIKINEVEVGENERTSIFSMTYANSDPQLAASFIRDLYYATETVLLQRERATADARVRAAQQQLADTTVETSRQALMNALTQFNIKAIQAKVGSPYAVRIISGPDVPDAPTRPSIRSGIVMGFLGGMLLAVFLLSATALYSAWVKSGRQPGAGY